MSILAGNIQDLNSRSSSALSEIMIVTEPQNEPLIMTASARMPFVADPQGIDTARSTQAQALLASLVGFIQPLMHAYVSAPASANSDADAAGICNGVEGQELLAALGRFVEALVSPQVHIQEDKISRGEQANEAARSQVTDLTSTPKPFSLPRPIMNQDLPPKIVQTVYQRVFNEMPIRVLAFDSSGSHMQLLERSAIANLILSRVQASAPSSGELAVEDGLRRAEAASRYAILSHTWIRDTPGDVVYGDWATREHPVNMRGYTKIAKFCQVAAQEHGVLFGWMDTVCINKESSTELDESIRSMYRWYRLSHVCVAYMAETPNIEEMHQDSWFTRGWTLQELLAPTNIQFHNKDWELLNPSPGALTIPNPGFKTELTNYLKKYLMERGLQHALDNTGIHFRHEIPMELQYQIYKATTITRSELLAFRVDSDAPIVSLSRKMQLAANRKVTREEDKIYSLMGLLGVGIPVAYGEGSRSAFIRLIREIMASKEYFMDVFNHGSTERKLLPSSITDYLNRSSIFDRIHLAQESRLHDYLPIEAITMTHLGVRIPLFLMPAFRKDTYDKHVPDESISRIVNVPNPFGSHDYLLLDNSKSSPDWINSIVEEKSTSVFEPFIVFLAILNFRTHNGTFSIPSKCISIPINLGVRAGSWDVDRINLTNIIQLSGPLVLPWPIRDLDWRISHDQMKRRGMQVVTLHMK